MSKFANDHTVEAHMHSPFFFLFAQIFGLKKYWNSMSEAHSYGS